MKQEVSAPASSYMYDEWGHYDKERHLNNN